MSDGLATAKSLQRTAGDVRVSGWQRRDRRSGYVFVAPQLLGMVVFVLAPFIGALVLAFAHWNGLTALSWVGFANFKTELTDPAFLRAIVNTLIITLVTVPVGLGLAIVIAVGLDRVKGRTIYLIMYFAPVVTSSVAVSLIWQQLLRQDGTISEAAHRAFGITPPDWLGNPHLVLLSICVVVIWSSLGLNVVIFLAGLQNIPPTLIEAARVDGAGPIRMFMRIRLPLLSPVIFFSTIVAVISSFQTFDVVFILTKNGGPDNASRTIVYHIYDTAFQHSEFGLASAASVILLVLTLGVTFIQLGLQRRLVHYES